MSNLVTTNAGLPSTQDFNTMKELGKMAVSSGLLPQGIRTPEQAVIIMLKGRELGIPPMQAFSSISVINGKPTMSAELMLSMIFRNVPGAVVNYLETTSQCCIIEAKRPGGKATQFKFATEDAQRADLLGKGPWRTYPGAMMRARCISAMARAMFPDALSGVVYTPEELGAEVDDEGEVVSIPVETIADAKPANVAAVPSPSGRPSPIQPRDEIVVDPDFGSYIVKGGKFDTRMIRDIPTEDLANYIAIIEAGMAESTTKPKPEVANFLYNVNGYLNQLAEEPA